MGCSHSTRKGATGEDALGELHHTKTASASAPAVKTAAGEGQSAVALSNHDPDHPLAGLDPPTPTSVMDGLLKPDDRSSGDTPPESNTAQPEGKTAADIFQVGIPAAAAAAAAAEIDSSGADGGYGIQLGDNIVPHDEQERLRALRMLGVVKQSVGHQFGSITSLLKLIFDVPVSQVFLVDEVDSFGVPNGPEERWAAYPRCTSHCRYIFEPARHELLVSEDLTQDMRFKGNPWVTQPPGFRFYASAPLVSTDGGHRYGTLCVIDFRPRHFSAEHYQMLSHMAEVAVRELESSNQMQWAQTKLDEGQNGMKKMVRSLDCFQEGIMLCDPEGEWEVRYVNSAFSRLTGLNREQAVGPSLWSLFGLPAAGPTADDLQASLCRRQPFTASIGLLPDSSPSGAGLATHFTATFSPASSPEFRPDEPDICIPIVPPPPGYKSDDSNGGDSGPGLENRLWFVTLQRPGQGASVDSGGSAPGSAVATRDGATNPIAHLRPSNMDSVRLGPLLGAGSFGRAYRGRWQGTEVCIKVVDLYTSLSPTPGAKGGNVSAAPLLEAALSKALLHPNIVPTHAWGISEGGINPKGEHHSQVWIVQSLCSVGPLASARDRGIFQDPDTNGPHFHKILLTMRDVAAALRYLHSVRVVHGDLSANNVLLSPGSPDERGFTAMVADFGLARPEGMANAVPRESTGTVPCMPPELLADDILSPAADSWAFGTLMWELLSGRRAWRGMGPMQIITAVTLQKRTLNVSSHWPQGIQDLVRSCFKHDPAERPTAQQLLERVDDLLEG